MSKSHECQRANVSREKRSNGLKVAEGSKEDTRLTFGPLEHIRKTALMAVGELSSETLHVSEERS